ncbi:hypothetical protein B0J11DRAFT_117254 [Dendryphion nanum]|uniref:tRNA wybutosine-synthesizing protein 4 n=1 Tax=Dendryphion nanum TaxID=256645 RepID=A0A9P9IE29_9PLEO|nr:hypothetical protein B0J11DRAFT_117254 [Dendryphion nanum]
MHPLREYLNEVRVLSLMETGRNFSQILTCISDPLPFQFWHRYPTICQNTVFVDVDYPQLIERKRNRMLSSDMLRNPLFKTQIRSSEPPIYLKTDKYMAVGCDLRDLETLERVLKNELPDHSILFVAEVSITYMPLADSNALIKWASTLDKARFCLLEQYLPNGPDHPFAKTMLSHFSKLQTSIYAVGDYPTLQDQASRFSESGWPTVEIAKSLWDIWSDNEFTPASLRRSLDSIEPFDEWEEFALFAGHYFLIVASTSGSTASTPTDDCLRSTDAPENIKNRDESASTAVDVSIKRSETRLTPRRFGAAFALDDNNVAFHGGQGPQQRLSSIDVLQRSDPKTRLQFLTTPHARICHTITSINSTDALLVGGRTSPAHALADCWLIKEDGIHQVQDLSPARYRHSSARVVLPCGAGHADIEGVMVFGGKTSDGSVLDECNLWTSHGWQQVSVVGSRPPARFGAAMCTTVGSNWGLIIGGLNADGTVLDDIWEFHISAAQQTERIEGRFTERTNGLSSQIANLPYARVGATLVPFADGMLLIGGVSGKNILGSAGDILSISTSSPGSAVQIGYANALYPADSYLLVGCGVTAVGRDEILIAGGGAVCFSMGSFWNEGCLTITKPESVTLQHWSVSVMDSVVKSPRQNLKPTPSKNKGKEKSKEKKRAGSKVATVSTVQIDSADDFVPLVSASKPVIIQGLDLGPCTECWTLDYLKDKIGADREIVIHESSSDRMTFKDKNFQYIKQSFGDFIDGIARGSKTYLRAVSAAQPNKLPTKLEDDFPTIAADFVLPQCLDSVVKEGYHSSPLRISGPVSLWLHYDVLANVLCQIRGSKTLRLYPPSDVRHLDFPPGGSSSNTNVLSLEATEQLRHAHPHVASLKPGDVLFIPPMWAHTATPEDGASVAVNVFWKNLDKGYAAGKDVYGNRDIQAYENGRRDVEKILRAFKDVPENIRRFYVERLAAELLEKA